MTRAMNGLTLIAQERTRQMAREGYSAQHDAQHVGDELALAAAVYAVPASVRVTAGMMRLWPFDWYFRPEPEDRVRELVKAGALIAAEIDRLQASDTLQGEEEG
jgi:hypothetical protein